MVGVVMKNFQCLDCFNCIEGIEKRPDKCEHCGSVKFSEFPNTFICAACGIEEDYKLMWFGDECLCNNCVPRGSCRCNTFATEEDAILHRGDAYEIYEGGDVWVLLDEKGRLLPCFDWLHLMDGGKIL
jgi:hypothetical protein